TDCFAAAPAAPRMVDAGKAGYTRHEADRLASPLPAYSFRGLYWKAMRYGLKLGARLSKGLRIGHEAGFDSGRMLDYVYRNEASGLTPAGRAIDRNYLNSVGWAGIRQRKVHIEELLHRAMARLSADDRPVRVLDIAAGHGRYILDAVSTSEHRPASITLRDFDAGNVEAGRRLIEQQGLGDIATFDAGDAFDPASFSGLDPQPTLAVVSGLYELFDDNGPIQASLAGLAAAVPAGGYFIYTCQPWHPQLELIARTLASHREGRPWIMRRRTQAEMDQLVAAAGFRKLDQRIDEHGIFTVCLAQRISS
ncbi:MAG: class I SAM-dependent methyltransferase family protein, partial [Hyphomicrobiales bacterium]|nr:class I SAM-dependent methyltransferase family protein [Hyphomicrobiales bacterium]